MTLTGGTVDQADGLIDPLGCRVGLGVASRWACAVGTTAVSTTTLTSPENWARSLIPALDRGGWRAADYRSGMWLRRQPFRSSIARRSCSVSRPNSSAQSS